MGGVFTPLEDGFDLDGSHEMLVLEALQRVLWVPGDGRGLYSVGGWF